MALFDRDRLVPDARAGSLAMVLARHGDTATLVLRGVLDSTACDELERAIARLEATRPRKVVVDLRNVSFLDSSGLRSLLGAERRMRRSGRDVSLVPGGERVQRVFELSGASGRFAIGR